MSLDEDYISYKLDTLYRHYLSNLLPGLDLTPYLLHSRHHITSRTLHVYVPSFSSVLDFFSGFPPLNHGSVLLDSLDSPDFADSYLTHIILDSPTGALLYLMPRFVVIPPNYDYLACSTNIDPHYFQHTYCVLDSSLFLIVSVGKMNVTN